MKKKRDFRDCEMLYDGQMKYGLPGWIEYIKKTGNKKWSVWYIPCDPELDYLYDKSDHDLKSLISYVLERDMWLQGEDDTKPSIPLLEEDREFLEHTNPDGLIGAHMNNLLNYFHLHKLNKELFMAKIAAGMKWINPFDVIDSDSIGLEILGVTRKAVWTGVYKKAYSVQSYYGSGMIYPPIDNDITYFFLDSDQKALSFDYKPRRIKLSKRCIDDLKKIQIEHLCTSIIRHIPHASSDIPSWLRNQFVLDDKQLQEELLKITDWYADELFTFPGSPRIQFPVSRLVCDAERFSDDAKEPMAEKGMGTIYRKTHTGQQLRRELSPREYHALIEQYHAANEKSMVSAIREALRSNETALIIDCHTFPSNPLSCDEDQRTPRPDFCIGTDDYHTPADLSDLVRDYFIQQGFSAAINRPYQGTYVPSLFYRRNRHVSSIMIEVNKSLYMDEKTGEKTNNFPLVKQHLHDVLSLLLNQLIQDYTEQFRTKSN